MTLALRPYQQDLFDRVRAAFTAHRTVCMQLPTGGGKTRIMAEILRRCVAHPPQRALFLAHLDALLDDTAARLRADGVPVGIIQGGRAADPTAPVQVASLQTLHRRTERPPADLVILDECHRAVAPSVRAVLEAYPDAVLLGGTATPQRGDARPLGDVFESLVAGPSMRDLITQGHLVPIDVFAPGKHYEDRLSADPVAAYTEHAPGKRAIVFAANSEHARQLAAAYAAAGYPSAVVLGTTGRQRRHDARAALEAGDIRVLVGCGVFIEGWDCPAVEVVVLARAFGVTGGYLQAIGRGTRPSPVTGKERCTVIDLRGAVHMHGLPDEDRIWSLTGAAVRRTETLPALARCRECLAITRPCRTCPRCGAAMQGAPKVPRVLTRGERLEKWSAVPAAVRDARYVARLVSVATQRMRMTPPSAERWAVARFRKQFGREPIHG